MIRLAKSCMKGVFVRTGMAGNRIRRSPSQIRILMYHGISPQSLPPTLFERQLRFIRRYFDTYWVSEIPWLLDTLEERRRPAAVLTFDDGLRNNAMVAAPLLEKYRIKATFYLVSDLLSGDEMLWNHELRCRLLLTPDRKLPGQVPALPGGRAARWRQAGAFIEEVKRWPDDRRMELVGAVREASGDVSWEPWMREAYQIMSVAEARALPPLVEVGSHTRTHPMLDQVSEAQAHDEIEGSRAQLESLLGRPVSTFCYPNGNLSESVLSMVGRTYDAAVTVQQGLAGAGVSLHRLPRIMAGESFNDFATWLVRPATLSQSQQCRKV